MKKIVLFFSLFLFLKVAVAQEKVISDVKIKGTKRTKAWHLKKLINVEAGQTLDSLMLEKDMELLKRLPSIAHAYYQIFETEDAEYDVFYHIEENFTLIPFANIFSSSNDDFAFRVGLQEFNLLGRNITLGGFYQYDVYNSFGLSIRAPYLFTKKLGLVFNYQNFTTLEPVFFDNSTADYRYNNKGWELLGLHQFDFKNRVELGFSLFTEDYQYISGITNAQVPTELTVDKHLFKLIYDHNDIAYFYQYLEGFRSTLNFQYVGSTDVALPEFLIGFNDFAYFHRVGERGNWATRLRLGLASNIETPFAPFTVDNNLNIRGVGNTIDRGTGAIVLNTEYRHSLIDKNSFVLQGNVFIDGGTWRNPGGEFSDFGDNDNIRIFPGIGVRFIHKKIFNAVFRIDYGYGITKDADRGIVFGIGQYF
jgi:outer membrane protein assembly factor BamA